MRRVLAALAVAASLPLGCIVYRPTLCAPCEGGCGEGLACVDGRCRSDGVRCLGLDASIADAEPDAEPDAALPEDAEPDAAPPDAMAPCAEGERLIDDACRGPEAISLSNRHGCARWLDGRVSCWGANNHGRFGVEDVRIAARPVFNPKISAARQIVAAGSLTCAVQADAVRCFGALDGREFGSVGSPLELPDDFEVASLAIGAITACALAGDGRVHCVGSDSEGQLGRGYLDAEDPPRFEAIGVGWGHACGLRAGAVICWGGENRGEKGGLGAGPQTLETDGVAVRQLAVGTDTTCLLLENGALRCYGDLARWEAGPFTDVAAKTFHACATRRDGEVLCFGYLLSAGWIPAGRPARGAAPDERLALGGGHGCLHAPGRPPACWGLDGRGVLTDPRLDALDPPIFEEPAAQVVVGEYSACALGEGGEVRCWGLGYNGRLGRAAGQDAHPPAPVPGLSATRLSSARGHTCAVSDGRLLCFGENADGQALPSGAAVVLQPTAVPGLSEVVEVAAGADFTCVGTATGAVDCFGDNTRGQLGRPEAGPAVTRVELPPVHGLAAGHSSACALDAEASVWCWGDDSWGQVSGGVRAEALAPPTRIPGVEGAVQLALGWENTCARLDDGAVTCWGHDLIGQPDGVRPASGPARVPGIAGATALSQGADHACVVMDSEIWCWGLELSERFGRERFAAGGNIFGPHPPTRIHGVTDALDVAVGVHSACARLEGGRLTCFGLDQFGLVSRQGHDLGAPRIIRSPR